MFDLPDIMSQYLAGSLDDNIQNDDLEVTAVECDWGLPMRYVLLNTSNDFRWYLHIQRNNVPIKSVRAYWTEKGKEKYGITSTPLIGLDHPIYN